MITVTNNTDEITNSQDYPVVDMVKPTFYNVGDTNATVDFVPVQSGNFINYSYEAPMSGYIKITFDKPGDPGNKIIVHYGTVNKKSCNCNKATQPASSCNN